jgi:hypothetical protein
MVQTAQMVQREVWAARVAWEVWAARVVKAALEFLEVH